MIGLLLLAPRLAHAGRWGQGSWDEMLWGLAAPMPEVPGLGPLGILVLLGALCGLGLLVIRRRPSLLGRVVIVLLVLVPVAAYAAQINTLPFSFSNGTIADANEVNANFDALRIESNAQDLRISAAEAAVTAAGDFSTHVADTDAHHLPTTSFTQLVDQALESQIPPEVTRDVEVLGLVLGGDGAGSGLDGDLLDGLDSDAFLRSDASATYTSGTFGFAPGTILNLDGTVSIGSTSGGDDDSLYFDLTSERLYWDDSDDRFEFSDDGAFERTVLIGHLDGDYAYNRIASSSAAAPGSGLMSSGADLYVGDDIEVGGSLYVDGLELSTPRVVIRSGADLSEGFDVRDSTSAGGAEIEPGTVVCIDRQHPGALRICTQAYDRTVAGVVSGAGGIATGLMMGQQGTVASGDHPVALTGRVYVKARAVDGPIRPGDLLTTSATAGYAMRVADDVRAPGAVLGKAMTSLEENEGLVLVLVALQ